MEDIKHPLAEVFGYLPTDFRQSATRFRKNKLCPFNNKVPNCTKDKAKDPLGVCSVNSPDGPVITCPVRFREDWLITDDAAKFFFGQGASWTSLTEVRLVDYYGKTAGNIDVVLAAYDEKGSVYDFGALEIQAVYISGNARSPFDHYMSDCKRNQKMDWTSQPDFPQPDFLSSSRKRLVSQLMFKGGMLNAWNKKMAVALNSGFFEMLPKLQEVDQNEAEMAWIVCDLGLCEDRLRYRLQMTKVVYTKFKNVLETISQPKVGYVEDFMHSLQEKIDEKLQSSP